MTKKESIAALMKVTGWNQKQLAAEMEVHPAVIQRACNPGKTIEGQWRLDLRLIPLCSKYGIVTEATLKTTRENIKKRVVEELVKIGNEFVSKDELREFKRRVDQYTESIMGIFYDKAEVVPPPPNDKTGPNRARVLPFDTARSQESGGRDKKTAGR